MLSPWPHGIDQTKNQSGGFGGYLTFREFGFVPGKLFGRRADFLDPKRLGFQEVLGRAQPPAPGPSPRSGGQSGCRAQC